jgi:chromosome segregation ATPase
MSETTSSPDEKQSPEEIQAHIEATRDRLAANVDALSEKLDVKAHAQDAVHDAGAKVQGAVADAKESVVSAAGAAAAQSRTLVQQFRALPLAAQAAIGAGVAAVVVTLIVRSARS